MQMFKQWVIPLLAMMTMAALFSTSAHAQDADETKLRQALQAKFPKLPIESITKMPFNGIFEVVMGGEIVYTDIRAEFMMGGTLYDIRNTPMRNITQDTSQRLASKALAGAHDSAIKMVRGNGRRVIYTFEDPNCGYCRELYKEFGKMTDVTIYTFLLPILSPDSREKSVSVWCSKDRAKAWDQLMTKTALTEQPKSCDTPLEKNAQLAQRFNIRGTPAVFLANGQQLGGYVPAAQIEQALAKK